MPRAEPGRMLSHYRLVEKIGEGGMGVVWKALDTKLNRHIALKLLPSELTGDPERRRRFLREARTAAAVTHPNIVTIHEVGEVDNVTFVSMELVEGRTLRSVIGGRPMPIPQALRVAAEIAEGLARAHDQGIVHRDLKPENVLLAADGHPKILDFGLAKLVEQRHEALRSQLSQQETRTVELTAEGAIVGTVAYMSPEQARGESVDARTDIFSFGVMLYEMVTGRHPFKGKSQFETVAAILHEPAASASGLNREVPAHLEELLGKCLEKDPGERYQTSRDLGVDLKRLARALASGTTPSYEADQGSRSRAKRPWILRLLPGVAVLVIAGVVLVWSPWRRTPAPAQVPAAPVHARSEIAVLPFENLSAESSQAYFAGGLHDELLTQLSKVASVKVISRTSVMGYAGTTKPLKVIADELGVGSIVEGSVQVVGSRLRVNVQLIDAASDQHVWAERYDRALDDAFAIQTEVAQQIVVAVGAALTSDELGRLEVGSTGNPDAYQLYLQGREYWLRPGPADRKNLEASAQLYEGALKLDPGFALAHAALSEVHGFMYLVKFDPLPDRAARQREEAETALRLAPDLPQARAAMGFYYYCQGDYPQALSEYEAALKGLPNDADLWISIGLAHRQLGHWEKSLLACEKAMQLDPRNAYALWELGWTYRFLHRYPEAVQFLDRAQRLAPDVAPMLAVKKGIVYFDWQGQLDSLRTALARGPGTGEEWGDRARALLMVRSPDRLLQMPEIVRGDVFVNIRSFTPAALYAGEAHQLLGDRVSAHEAYGLACSLVDSALKELPDDWRLHASRGLALAGLGRKAEAIQEAHRLEQSDVYREDAFGGDFVARARAAILAQAGDAEAALDEIERLLTQPSFLSVHNLRLDPQWDPIRDHPRFKALLAKYRSSPTS